MMKIKIIKSMARYWYKDHIGQVFGYEGLADDGGVMVGAVVDGEFAVLPVRSGDFEMLEYESDDPQPVKWEGKIKMIYVACALNAETDLEISLNIAAARHAGYKIAKAGFYPVMPTVNTKGFEKANSLDFWYASTLELLRRCDAVYVVDGSHESTGVRGELAEAERLEMPVYHNLLDLIIDNERKD